MTMNMKQYTNHRKFCLSLLLCATLLIGSVALLAGCGDANQSADDPAKDGVLTVVCTNFAGYDFAREITRGYADTKEVRILLLGKPGQDMHSYEPTAADILTVRTADVVVCVGGSSEQWLESTLRAAQNEAVTRVTMTEVCDTMEDTYTEGMDTDHDHDHDHTGDEDSCGLIDMDEHVWLSVENAMRITAAMEQAFVKADPTHAAVIEAGAEAYLAELATLRSDYAAMMEGAVRDSILIADRYPFAYLVRELGLTCYAAFPGCSSETSASFATQTFLIEKTRALQLPYIFMIDGSDGSVAATVAKETGAEVLTLDSLQVVTDYETSYIAAMRKNLENLKKALY